MKSLACYGRQGHKACMSTKGTYRQAKIKKKDAASGFVNYIHAHDQACIHDESFILSPSPGSEGRCYSTALQ